MSYSKRLRSLAFSFFAFSLLATVPATYASAEDKAKAPDGASSAEAPAAAAPAAEAPAMGVKDQELFEGDANAPVTITEYSSFTCPHCATFHNDTYPALKKKYIDTGKVKIIFRPFPLDPLAAAVSMLAKCVPPEQHFPIVHKFFKEQKAWAYSNSPVDSLKKIWSESGFESESFDKCLKNQKILDSILSVKAKAAKELEIQSTPTFDVNGEVVRGALPFKDFEKLIKSKLNKK